MSKDKHSLDLSLSRLTKLEAAFRRSGWSASAIGGLCQGDALERVRAFLYPDPVPAKERQDRLVAEFSAREQLRRETEQMIREMGDPDIFSVLTKEKYRKAGIPTNSLWNVQSYCRSYNKPEDRIDRLSQLLELPETTLRYRVGKVSTENLKKVLESMGLQIGSLHVPT